MKSSNLTSSNSFSFDIFTSDGDKLSFDYSDSNSLISDENSLLFSATKSYQFEYNGNGISSKDKKEIAQALEKINPLMIEFFTKRDDEPLNQIAKKIEDIVPYSKDSNLQNFVKSSLVDKFDSMLNPLQFSRVRSAVENGKEIPKIEETFKSMREILDEVFNLLDNGRPIYA